jgi:hypothetical protein
MTNENVENVFNGFLNLAARDKLKLVKAINEYFDSNNREPIREAHNKDFETIDFSKHACICCKDKG